MAYGDTSVASRTKILEVSTISVCTSQPWPLSESKRPTPKLTLRKNAKQDIYQNHRTSR